MADLATALQQLLAALVNNTLATLLLVIIAAGVGVLIYAQYKKDNFDLRALIVDPVTKQPSIHQLGQFTALVISSWGLIVLVLHDKLTEAYFSIYMAVWAGANTLDRFLTIRDENGKHNDGGGDRDGGDDTPH
jgi:hypothetical protein